LGGGALRAATPPPSFPDDQPDAFHRAVTSPPSFSRRPTGCISPSCNIATILSRENHPAVFHRAATSPPYFPETETTSQLSSTELHHRHHLFPRRPASCLPPSCDIAIILFPDDHTPSPGCCLRLEFGQLLLLFFFNTLLQPDAPVARHRSRVRSQNAASTFVLHTYCLIFFVVSLFLFSTLLQIHTILSTTAMSMGARRICCFFVARGGSFLFEVACVNVSFLHRNINCAAPNTRFLSRCA
jgi:hypothetical protein